MSDIERKPRIVQSDNIFPAEDVIFEGRIQSAYALPCEDYYGEVPPLPPLKRLEKNEKGSYTASSGSTIKIIGTN